MQTPGAHESTGLQSQPPPEEQNYGATAAHVRQGPFVSASRSAPAKRQYLIAAVLCYANLINFMDWFIVPGILLNIQKYFKLSDGDTGLLQTVFILCYMLAAPIFGYLGDRYNRKIILGAGIFFWSGVTLGSSFINELYYWIFFLSRGLLGIGTASFSTIAPTIIADLFEEGKRTTMLSVFYIFIPVGSFRENLKSANRGLGYVLAAGMAGVTGDWHWAFRVTPCMGGLALVLLILLVPHRMQRRTAAHRALSISGTIRVAAEKPGVRRTAKTTWCQDVISLAKNWSFVWSSLGLTAMAFVTGALGMWVPVFLYRAQVVQGLVPPCLQETCDSSNSLIFGGITIGTGILGVIAGAEAARRLRKINNKADPLICATSMFVSAVCLYIALMVAQTNILSTFALAFLFLGSAVHYSLFGSVIFIALGELFLSVNWAVVTDILLVLTACGTYSHNRHTLVSWTMLLLYPPVLISINGVPPTLGMLLLRYSYILVYVVTPRRQSTAIALQILVSHLLGDAGSPYLVGTISHAIQDKNAHSFQWSFWSMQYSFILCSFVGVCGGAFFLLTSFYIEEDHDEEEECESTGEDSDWEPSSEDKNDEDVEMLFHGVCRFVKAKNEPQGTTV